VDEMLLAIDEREHQIVDAANTEQRALRGRTLPAGRIVFVPFTLVEVEQQAEDERR
jgi:hypothetical protein